MTNLQIRVRLLTAFLGLILLFNSITTFTLTAPTTVIANTGSDDYPDFTLWTRQISGGAQISYDPSLTMTTNADYNVSWAEIVTPYRFTGDFDVQVDYRAVSGWDDPVTPPNGLIWVASMVVIIDESHWVQVALVVNPKGQMYAVWSPMDGVPATFMASSPREYSGKLRIARWGSTIYFYVYSRDEWQFRNAVTFTRSRDPASVSLRVYSDVSYNRFSTVFENFRINSPIISNVWKTDVTVDYQSVVGSFEKSKVLNLAEGGYSPMADLDWFPKTYDNLQATNVSMVRLDHTTNDWCYHVVSKDTKGNLIFNFSKIDKVLLPMLDHGLKPLMCLSYTPSILGSSDYSVPSNLSEWKKIVYAYVDHYRKLGFTGWYWEVWNEPDGPEFWEGSFENYLELYRYTAQGVKEADPSAKVGGPSISIWVDDYNQLLPKFFTFIHDNPDAPLDFVSWATYNQTSFTSVQAVKREMAAANIGQKELLITEWGHDVDPLDIGAGHAKDTNRVAPYMAKLMASAINFTDITKIFYFSAADGARPDLVFTGDAGILTYNMHRKAAYNVFVMMNKMQPSILSTKASRPLIVFGNEGTGFLATKNEDTGQVAIIIWNDSGFNQTINLNVDNLPRTKYASRAVVTKSLIDENHANSYLDYSMSQFQGAYTPHENLAPLTNYIDLANKTYSTTEQLKPYSVLQIILEPATNAYLKLKSTDTNSNPLMLTDVASLKTPIGQDAIRGITDANGDYVVNSILPGSYSFEFRKEGYESKIVNLIVSKDQLNEVESALQKSETKPIIHSIKVYIKDNNGTEVAGANVSSMYAPIGQLVLSKVSEENGTVTFVDVLPGDYKFKVEKSGYITESKSISIVETGVNEIVFTITPAPTKGSLLVVVKDSTGNTLSEATVSSVSQPSGQSSIIGTSAADGSVTFTGLAVGNYTFQVSKEGYTSTSVKGIVKAGFQTELSVTLQVQKWGGIPGFPFASVVIGVLLFISLYWSYTHRPRS